MKRKVVLKNNITGKTIENDIVVRDYDHFRSQVINKSFKFKDKTKYSRKQKHKERLF